MVRWNSRWDYLICGGNLVFAFVGALAGSFPLLAVGIGCAIWSWHVAEAKRHLEALELLEAHGVTLEQGNDNGKDNEEDQQ